MQRALLQRFDHSAKSDIERVKRKYDAMCGLTRYLTRYRNVRADPLLTRYILKGSKGNMTQCAG